MNEIWGPKVAIGYFENEESGMKCTGVPGLIKILVQLEQITDAIKAGSLATIEGIMERIGTAQGV